MHGGPVSQVLSFNSTPLNNLTDDAQDFDNPFLRLYEHYDLLGRQMGSYLVLSKEVVLSHNQLANIA